MKKIIMALYIVVNATSAFAAEKEVCLPAQTAALKEAEKLRDVGRAAFKDLIGAFEKLTCACKMTGSPDDSHTSFLHARDQLMPLKQKAQEIIKTSNDESEKIKVSSTVVSIWVFNELTEEFLKRLNYPGSRMAALLEKRKEESKKAV